MIAIFEISSYEHHASCMTLWCVHQIPTAWGHDQTKSANCEMTSLWASPRWPRRTNALISALTAFTESLGAAFLFAIFFRTSRYIPTMEILHVRLLRHLWAFGHPLGHKYSAKQWKTWFTWHPETEEQGFYATISTVPAMLLRSSIWNLSTWMISMVKWGIYENLSSLIEGSPNAGRTKRPVSEFPSRWQRDLVTKLSTTVIQFYKTYIL